MNELEKINHLITHWMDHNKDHVKSYNEWADRAEAMGEHRLAEILRRIADESKKLDGLFTEAIDNMKR